MIWQMIEDWFRGILTDGILSNLSGLFDSVNTEVGEIATQVGTTPAGWNAGIFNMIQSARSRHLDFLQVDFQNLCCGAAGNKYLEHRHGRI